MLADQSVTLAWDPNPEPDVSGYIVYYGHVSRNYPYHTNVGNVTTATVYGLQEGWTCYFAITATNTAGLESDFSNEVTNAVPPDATNRVPSITPIADQIIHEDQETSALTFRVADAETAAASLLVTASSTNTVLVPEANIRLAGTGQDRTVQVRPAADQFGTTLITLTVSDGSKASSTSFRLTVYPVNDPPTLHAIASPPVLAANSGPQNVILTGLSSGSPNEHQWLSVTILPLDPRGITTPIVHYQPLSGTATVQFAPGLSVEGDTLVTVIVKDNGGTSRGGQDTITRQFVVSVRHAQDLWREQFFTASDLANPAKEATLWGDSADPDGDGWENLVEYALGLVPTVANAKPTACEAFLENREGQMHAVLGFNRRNNDSRLSYVVETSDDLRGWRTDAYVVWDVGDATHGLGPEFERVTCRDMVSLAAGAPRFLRLRVVKANN